MPRVRPPPPPAASCGQIDRARLLNRVRQPRPSWAARLQTAAIRLLPRVRPRCADRPIGPVCPTCIVRGSPARHLPHVTPNRGRSEGLKGLVYIYVESICMLGTFLLSHQLPSQPGQSDQQTGDFAHFTQQRSYGRQFAYSSCAEPKMGRLCVYHDHLAAQSILVND